MTFRGALDMSKLNTRKTRVKSVNMWKMKYK